MDLQLARNFAVLYNDKAFLKVYVYGKLS